MINKTILSESIAGRMPVKYVHKVYSSGSIIDAKTGIEYTHEEYCNINPHYAKAKINMTNALSRSMRITK